MEIILNENFNIIDTNELDIINGGAIDFVGRALVHIIIFNNIFFIMKDVS